VDTRRLWAWLVELALVASLVGLPANAAAQAAPYCQADQAPAFESKLAPLASQLGAFMGDPVECAHRDAASGDLQQATTTGLAYVRAALDTPVFTDGDSHVALTDQGLSGWDGTAVDAPLRLSVNGGLPTWCNAQAIAPGVNGFLCIYANQSVAAWSPAPNSSDWQLLGTEADPNADWMLTAVGQALIGMSLPLQPPASGVAPPDSELEVSLQPVSPSPPPSFPLLTGSICNRSSVWTATSVEIDFAFFADGLSPTNDHGSYSVASVPPDSCQPFLASLSALYPWQTITASIGRVNWRR
jgi:hypothetical protein